MYESRPRIERDAAPPSETFTLTQLTEILRGQADALLNRTRQLQEHLGRAPIEKDPGHPERTHSGPSDILLNAKDDLHRVERILEELIAYVGQPGEGPRGESARSAGGDYQPPRVTTPGRGA